MAKEQYRLSLAEKEAVWAQFLTGASCAAIGRVLGHATSAVYWGSGPRGVSRRRCDAAPAARSPLKNGRRSRAAWPRWRDDADAGTRIGTGAVDDQPRD
jgi:hypothetical protein